MKKRFFIVHGWSGSPEEPLLKWLALELKKKGFEVYSPKMPEADEPKIVYWINFLSKEVGELNENTYFIGHSIGCQAIMRYLEMTKYVKAGGAVFIAPWVHLTNISKSDFLIVKSWLKEEINFENVVSKANKYVAIFSDNDPYVPLSNTEIFEKSLGAKVIVEKGKGHFSKDDGVLSSNTALKEAIGITK